MGQLYKGDQLIMESGTGTDIHGLTEKASLSPDDEFIIADSDNIYNNKKIKYSNAIKINGLTEKSATADNDILLIGDSQNTFSSKKVKVRTIKDEIIYGDDLSSRISMPITVITNDGRYGEAFFHIGKSPYYYYRAPTGSSPFYKHSILGSSNSREIINANSRGMSGGGNGVFVYKGYVYICTCGSNQIKIVRQSIYGNRTTVSERDTVLTASISSVNWTRKFFGYDGTYFYLNNSGTIYRIATNGTSTTKTLTVAGNITMNEKGNIVVGLNENSQHYLCVYDNFENMNLIKKVWISNSSQYWSASYFGVIGDIIYLANTITTNLSLFLPSIII